MRENPRCRLTCSSVDGFGHQYDAKLGCIAVAASIPGVEYIHSPFLLWGTTATWHEAEEIAGLSGAYSSARWSRLKSRRPHADPWYPLKGLEDVRDIDQT
jgi:hypothetical protein